MPLREHPHVWAFIQAARRFFGLDRRARETEIDHVPQLVRVDPPAQGEQASALSPIPEESVSNPDVEPAQVTTASAAEPLRGPAVTPPGFSVLQDYAPHHVNELDAANNSDHQPIRSHLANVMHAAIATVNASIAAGRGLPNLALEHAPGEYLPIPVDDPESPALVAELFGGELVPPPSYRDRENHRPLLPPLPQINEEENSWNIPGDVSAVPHFLKLYTWVKKLTVTIGELPGGECPLY